MPAMLTFKHRILVFATTVACLVAHSAQDVSAAESPMPTRHAVDYRLDWIPFIDPNDLPPSRYAVCLVDSGLAVTPDVPATSAHGPVVARLSIDGASGEPEGSADAQMHGTKMAMAATAPSNDWGTNGIWPQGRVVGMRAMVGGETQFRPTAYRVATERCRDASGARPIAVTNLSLGCRCTLTETQRATLKEEIARAHEFGMSVVAAAGNEAGEPTAEPANVNGVVAVAAGGRAGMLCSYSTHDALVQLLAPGCDVDRADVETGTPVFDNGGGSSMAAIATSMVIAMLRTLRPDATRLDAEGWLREGARVVDGRRVLDGEGAARAAGLGGLVDRARARMAPSVASSPTTVHPSETAAPQAPQPEVETASPTTHSRRLGLPEKVTARWARGRLEVFVRRPESTAVEAVALYMRNLRVVRRVRQTRARSRIVIRLRRPPHGLRVRLLPTSRSGDALPSPPAFLSPTRRGIYR